MTLYLLGTGAAVSDAHRTTTMLAVATDGPGGRSTLAIDCGGDLVQRLMAAGIDLGTLDGLVVTHEHPDHVSGFPLFMEKIWLAGRKRPIPVFGIAPALAQARRVWEAFETSGWDVPEIDWRAVPHQPGAPVLDDDAWRVTAAPAIHPVPTIGLRIEEKATGRVVAYSCDTAPSDAIAQLARGADVLVHEANGHQPGTHSSIEEAAGIAAQAEVGRLLLVHLPPGLTDADLERGRQRFRNVAVGEELGVYGV